MELSVGGAENTNLFQFLKLQKTEIRFYDGIKDNIFSKYTTRTLGQILDKPKYKKLKNYILNNYENSLTVELGKFCSSLKNKQDRFYINFLNKFGDEKYIHFEIIEKDYFKLRGLYFFYVKQDLKYVGRCRDNYKKRFNQGYGKIAPKNCYLDGQSTNCHINSLIAKNMDNTTLWLYPLENVEHIILLEKSIINEYKPEWNIALKH